MVHIKKLEIYGFKSFDFKNTIIKLEKGLVTVTGPNGSGKSNILDAIIFALGENSPKSLRVDKLLSLFHDSQDSSSSSSSSSSSPHPKLIRVSLQFDNSDRGIPVDSDSISLTREMEGGGGGGGGRGEGNIGGGSSSSGESQYYLNSKKVSKTTITELLEMVLAAPNNLNIVQQGMITRISELNSEERIKIIEDIVGLSYFDDKKVEALKQLEEADRRLEIAFARMGEIRKRIDELEEERNDQFRYEQLESELKRFKAIQLNNTIKSMGNKLKLQNKVLDSNGLRLSELSEQIEKIRSQIENLDSEKIKFIQEGDTTNRAKAQIESRLTNIVYESERIKAILNEAEQRVIQIDSRIFPSIDLQKQNIHQKLQDLRSQKETNKNIIDQKSSKISILKSELEKINNQVDILATSSLRYTNLREKLEDRYKKLSTIRNQTDIKITRLEEKIKTIIDKIQSNDVQIFCFKSEIEKNGTLICELNKMVESQVAKLGVITSSIRKLRETKNALEGGLESSSHLLSRADNFTIQYEAKASSIANNTAIMKEDIALSELMKDPEKFGIRGLVYDVLRWDKNYERSILASGSEWMKAIVVDDVKSMISVAEYAKVKKLPHLKIIPLDIVFSCYYTKKGKRRDRRRKIRASSFPPSIQNGILDSSNNNNNNRNNHNLNDDDDDDYYYYDNDDVNIVGNLADFVYSDYEKLPEFLFADTFLVKTPTAAYNLSRQGYKAVSVDGELFEPLGGSMSLDFGSKISDLTEAISFLLNHRGSSSNNNANDSINILRNSLTRLKTTIEKKSSDLKQIVSKINYIESDGMKIEAEINNLNFKISTIATSTEQLEATLQSIILNNKLAQTERDSFVAEIEKYHIRSDVILKSIKKLTEIMQHNSDSIMRNELAQKNMKKNQILKSIEAIDFELRQLITSSSAFNKEIEISREQLERIDKEKEQLELELRQRRVEVDELQIKFESMKKELKLLRDHEQQIIDLSGRSYSVLQEYDKKIKTLSENERKLTKEYNNIERDTAILKKDILELTSQQSRLTEELSSLGYNDKSIINSSTTDYYPKEVIKEKMEQQKEEGETTAVRKGGEEEMPSSSSSDIIDEVLKGLNEENESIKTRINLRADESYVQVIEGYRSMSDRKNQLEMERNSIVLFIEEVIKEKKSIFAEAFKKVDNDLRKTFSEMTEGGGTAWLEKSENNEKEREKEEKEEQEEEDFSKGLILMVQFPGKPGRESTALSGGEKTMAAIVFLLALQSLKPSPFYLMDEVDAHLDAENTERLSKVLLERSKGNQMITVTLKDFVLAKSNLIYGVYSKEGSSHVVGYRPSFSSSSSLSLSDNQPTGKTQNTE